MFVDYTWQDWIALGESDEKKTDMLKKIVAAYKSSADFKQALTASQYFAGDNPEIKNKVYLTTGMVETTDERTGRKRKTRRRVELKGVQMPNSVFYTFVVQENQHLLGNGVSFSIEEGEPDPKDALGRNFDTNLSRMGENALQHGVCYAFWNLDHVEIIKAAADKASGCVAIVDEKTSAIMMAVQFWQIADRKPMYIRTFEPDGITIYRLDVKKDAELVVDTPKTHYIRTVYSDAAGEEIMSEEDYGVLPVIPLYANEERRSELTEAIRAKIDAYDRILSDFGDNLQRANDVYWVLNNFGGTTDDMLQMIADIQALRMVASMSDGMGGQSTAEPHTIEVPYQARQTALDVLKRAMYRDAMALDMDQLTGGSLTNVAIQAATANLNLKCDRYEWQVIDFMEKLLALIGMPEAADHMTLTRRTLTNATETVNAIAMMREDIDIRTALKLNPLINPDDIDGIVAAVEAEKQARASSFDEIDRLLRDHGSGSNPDKGSEQDEGTVTDGGEE